MQRIIFYIMALAPTLLLNGCFTGIEGTPKITSSYVKKENIHVTPEQEFLADVKCELPKDWHTGKRFLITDPRVSLVFGATSPIDTSGIKGKHMIYETTEKVKSVTGEEIAILRFNIEGQSQDVTYDTNTPYETFLKRENLEIPFTVDLDMIAQVRSRMKGKTYYITTPLWYDPATDKSENGLRHVAVEIVDVQGGTSVYPIKVIFRMVGKDSKHAVLMTIGNKRTSTRNFHTLFAFNNPREKYPLIQDDTWQLITNSKVRTGMTKDECRLALGSPDTWGQIPTTAGMVEYWSYSEGIYLLFEDGYLTRVR